MNLTAGSLQRLRQDDWSLTASSGKANDWRNRQRVALDLFSNLKWERSTGFFGEPLKHVMTQRGQILVSTTDDDPLAPVCRFNKSTCARSNLPCAPAARAQVFQHVRVVPAYTGTFLAYTRGRCGVSHTTQNPLGPWRLHRNGMIQRLEEEHDTCFARSFLLEGALWLVSKGIPRVAPREQVDGL